MGRHADDESMFGGKIAPIRIVSLSLGNPRVFQMRTKHKIAYGTIETTPDCGDLFVMEWWF